MLPILSNDGMREADRHTIEDLGVPSLVLMENAATGVVDAIRESFPEARRVLFLCGRGNNGGDGFVFARALREAGHHVALFFAGVVVVCKDFSLSGINDIGPVFAAGIDEKKMDLKEIAQGGKCL